MSTYINDFKNAVGLFASLYPALVDDSANGETVDMIGSDSQCFAIQFVGTVNGTNPTLDGKIQESTDGSTWTDVTGATFVQVTAAEKIEVIVFQRTKQYLRHSRAIGGTSPEFTFGVLIGEVKKTF